MGKRFSSIGEVMADLQAKQSKRLSEKQKQQEEPGAVAEYECDICRDTELVTYNQPSTNGFSYEYGRPCECRERKAWKRRFKNALIPDEFTHATFDNYISTEEIHNLLYDTAVNYLALYKKEGPKKTIPDSNLGFIAVFGEQRLKELESSKSSALKEKHNSFGLGKTHLQIAIAKRLIKDGFNVLVVSDVVLMDELIQAKRMNDEGEMLNRLLGNAISADVLLWDDIGKSKWSEAKESLYYQIINERYRKQRPIVFSSNEDRGTLAEKIGYAAASRLIGQCGLYLVEAEGSDYRLKK